MRVTNCYDDAELHAIETIRLVSRESAGGVTEAAPCIDQHVGEMFQKFGTMGILALVEALARHASIHVDLSADRAGITPDAWLDDWALHKMSQRAAEDDDPDDEPGWDD